MEKQLQTNLVKEFTLLESLLVLLIINTFIYINITHINNLNFSPNNSERVLANFINQINYLKSKAIKEHQSIAIQFSTNSNKFKVIEEQGKKYTINIEGGKIIHLSKIKVINLDKNGKITPFGSVSIKINNVIYRVIFNIDQGRIRYVQE